MNSLVPCLFAYTGMIRNRQVICKNDSRLDVKPASHPTGPCLETVIRPSLPSFKSSQPSETGPTELLCGGTFSGLLHQMLSLQLHANQTWGQPKETTRADVSGFPQRDDREMRQRRRI